MILEIPQTLDHIIFRLQWQYPENYLHTNSLTQLKPPSKRKSTEKRKASYVVDDVSTGVSVAERCKTYLNASCFVYSRTTFLEVFDSNPEHQGHTSICRGVIVYSGGRMNDQESQGLHTIQVFLQRLPSVVTDLFFTLSSWDSLSINDYSNLNLTCHDAWFPELDLCKVQLARRGQGGAVIMCRVSRSDKGWKVLESGKVSEGYANDYGPIKDTINKILSSEG